MSRPELQEYEFPPGLGTQHPRSNEHDHPVSYAPAALGSFAHQDRRSSSGAASFAAFGGGLPRSYAMQDARDYNYGISLPEIPAGPNRHNPTPSLAHLSGSPPFSTFNHHSHRPSPPPLPANAQSGTVYLSSSASDRDAPFFRQPQAAHPQQPAANSTLRSTLWWGELEPWMDEEYAKQVCGLMNWEPVGVKVPHPAPDPSCSQQQANNPGYCFLTFPSPAHAASVLAQINNGGAGGKGTPTPMPNSSKPFVMNWASSVTSTSPISAAFPASTGMQSATPAGQYPKEYSIFVGDLAPETSNSDLVAVFRNPVLGLRNDREPKFIRPFLSCKSAKIMLDPLTGVSRGYGFVRFTDEADQQRALIEMHGLYCLSRPMRISPATAKFKPSASVPPFDLPQVSFTPPINNGAMEGMNQPVTIAVPLSNGAPVKSVSAPIAAASSSMSLNSNTVSNSTSGSSLSSNSLSSGTGSSTSISTSGFSVEEMMGMSNNVLAQLAQFTTNDLHPIKMASANPHAHDDELRRILAQQADNPAPRYIISEESWKHQAQARAILGNLIGPNGEQLTSTDPYNTTVFVGGLSPLISEDTLRTFFAPFGDIHYVKVPVGKHCGFVQFVRKADAERAIDKMQGFPIGGSRIRLSWGRSQYKAAQAAAQAAQAAAMQNNYIAPTPGSITQDQALQILQKLALQGYPATGNYDSKEVENALLSNGYNGGNMLHSEQKVSKDDGTSGLNPVAQRPDLHRAQSNFSPFSPDPNHLYTSSEGMRRETNTASYSRLETLPHPSKAYAPGFFPQQSQDLKINTGASGPTTSKVSPVAARPSSASRYGFAENSDPPTRATGRSEAPISRPSSGQMPALGENHESDHIQDLNGTLASLDLDRPWMSPEVGKKVTSG